MAFHVYILQSEVDHTYYKGYTSNITQRLDEHNNGFSRYTSKKIPWRIVYLEEFQTKREALIRERQLKRVNQNYLRSLISEYSLKNQGS
jgi:putative endonuclease